MSTRKNKYIIPNVQHFSLDPRGAHPDLTFQFKPTWQSLCRKDVLAASEYEPYVTLPRVLIPVPGHPLRPPKMRYGWIANTDALVELAKELDCVEMCAPPVTYSDESDDEDLDEEERQTVIKEKYDNSTPVQAILTSRYNPDKFPSESEGQYMARRAGWDVFWTFDRVVDIVKEEELAARGALDLTLVLFHKSTPFMISAFTNYDLTSKRLPSVDDLDKLARRLGLQGKAQWFLDSLDWRWHDNGQPY
ncbi:uncharacterized protein FIBRA_07750 [Fibroporia radiculosa]|uniref:Uncharacterized protein n=1 Tax=Fibroporia radiculosa TaxID=599839 RepID=J4H4T0_9APHY|nr:uncharacterized protein FIBRA_07750 [Fibroporia radiculosa]CCM05524.1 predicted protein [Fibroporia radiculosa]